MTQKNPSKPTPTELEILSILWDKGPSTVREVHEVLSRGRKIGYTGALKFLQIMTAKGSVIRNEDERAHVYQAKEPADETKRRVARDVLQKIFGGSVSQLVLHLIEDKKASPDEIEEIRRLLDDYDQKGE